MLAFRGGILLKDFQRGSGIYGGDSTAPLPVITSDAAATVYAPFDITITFINGIGGDPEDVIGFVIGDITVTNGAASNFVAVSGSVYTATITPTASGTVTVGVAAGVCTDGTNLNTAATDLTRVYGVLIIDTFTDTNGTGLDAHMPNLDNVGGGWTEVSGVWSITSNRLVKDGGAGIATIDAGEADVTMELIVNLVSTTSTPGIVLRYADSTHYWTVRINNGTDAFEIVEVNGASTVRDTVAFAPSLATDYTIRVAATGQTITATLDGANALSYGGAALNVAVTVHGIQSNKADTFDDFEVSSYYPLA